MFFLEEVVIINVYCEGVNVYINSFSLVDYFIEFKLLGYVLELWMLLYIVVFYKFMLEVFCSWYEDIFVINV